VPGYVAFLRAVNLGATRKVPMAQLRAVLEEAGLEDVETYIHTGNGRFRSAMRSRARIEAYVEQVIAADRGFDVPTMAFTPAELRVVHDGMLTAAPQSAARRYVTLLKREPPADAAREVETWGADGEGAKASGRAVYWWLDGPMQQARISNARIENVLGPATTRDFKVVTTLAQRWGA